MTVSSICSFLSPMVLACSCSVGIVELKIELLHEARSLRAADDLLSDDLEALSALLCVLIAGRWQLVHLLANTMTSGTMSWGHMHLDLAPKPGGTAGSLHVCVSRRAGCDFKLRGATREQQVGGTHRCCSLLCVGDRQLTGAINGVATEHQPLRLRHISWLLHNDNAKIYEVLRDAQVTTHEGTGANEVQLSGL